MSFQKVVGLRLRKSSEIQQAIGEPTLLLELEEVDQTSAQGVKGGGEGISSVEESLW